MTTCPFLLLKVMLKHSIYAVMLPDPDNQATEPTTNVSIASYSLQVLSKAIKCNESLLPLWFEKEGYF